MRALCLVSFLVVAAGCGSNVLDNTAYRRVVDGFDSADQCAAEGDFARCYDILTFCDNGRVNAVLDFRQEGSYEVHEDEAIAQLPYMTVVFDLEKASSTQLPGRHPWELVEPLYYDCGR
jgi:hypothetical protein